MQIQINYGDIDNSDSLSDHVEQALGKELEHVSRRLTRVEVHLRDDKQKRRGRDDKRCTMEARIAGEQPLAVEARSHDIYLATSDAAAKLARAVTRRLERLKE